MGTEGTLDRRRNEISDGAGRCSGVDRTNDGLVEGGDRPQRWHTSTRTYVEYARRGEEQENRRRDMGGCGQAGSREREEAPWKICCFCSKGYQVRTDLYESSQMVGIWRWDAQQGPGGRDDGSH